MLLLWFWQFELNYWLRRMLVAFSQPTGRAKRCIASILILVNEKLSSWMLWYRMPFASMTSSGTQRKGGVDTAGVEEMLKGTWGESSRQVLQAGWPKNQVENLKREARMGVVLVEAPTPPLRGEVGLFDLGRN